MAKNKRSELRQSKLAFSARRESNSELFVWALYLLGGADRDVDVEEIYLKCFQLAPARLAWRTRPDIPDYKKTSKALQSVEAETNYILKKTPYLRRLSTEGLNWIEINKANLEKMYSGNVVPQNTNKYFKIKKDIEAHLVWQKFKQKASENVIHILADALKCSLVSSDAVWQTRFLDLERTAQVLQDNEFELFRNWAIEVYKKEKNGNR